MSYAYTAAITTQCTSATAREKSARSNLNYARYFFFTWTCDVKAALPRSKTRRRADIIFMRACYVYGKPLVVSAITEIDIFHQPLFSKQRYVVYIQLRSER